jgi:hypothetical protein
MSPIIDFENEDFLRGTVVEPGWYVIMFGPFTEELTKDGKSTNYLFRDSKIVCHADSGDTKFTDVPIKISFSAKKEAKGFILGLFAAVQGFNSVEELQQSGAKRIELEALSGTKIEALVENHMWEGRMSNRINHKYRPLSNKAA